MSPSYVKAIRTQESQSIDLGESPDEAQGGIGDRW